MVIEEPEGPLSNAPAQTGTDAGRELRLLCLGLIADRLAHDFKNILFGIDVYAGFLEGDASSEDRSRDVATVRRAVAQGTELARRVMEFAEAREPAAIVDLASTIDSAAPVYELLLGSGIALERCLSTAPLTAALGRTCFEEILLRLLLRARARIDTGTVRIELAAVQPGPETPGGLRPGLHARLVVVDSGPDMDAVDSADGLAVVAELVRAAGGALVTARGPEVTILLPAAG